MTVDEIRTHALQLSTTERELLAVELLGSLSDEALHDEITSAWGQEIAERSRRHRQGEATSRDAHESLTSLRERFAAEFPQ